jgi:hypothetical protein
MINTDLDSIDFDGTNSIDAGELIFGEEEVEIKKPWWKFW